jgi:general secretion pathway protein H
MPQRGFTLIEVMVVLALLGMATGLVALAWPTDPHRALQRDAERVAAVLQAQRVLSRSTGQPRWWQVQGGELWVHAADTGPLPVLRLRPQDPRVHWRSALDGQRHSLGPEPIVPGQTLQVWRNRNGSPAEAGMAAGSWVLVATDGVRPFAVQQP